jgi:undecaprenyl-diphosphatase
MTDEAVIARVARDDAPRPPWRLGMFGPASEEPYRRRTTDYLRFVLAVALLVATAFHEGDATKTERDLFTFFNRLPDDLRSLFTASYRFGALWAVALLVLAAVVARRRRLARDLAIAGVAAWAVGRLLGAVVVEHESLGAGIEVLTRIDSGPSYPLVPLAVITAVIGTAGPYVRRPVRRTGQVVVVVLGLAALYLGTGFPNGVFAAVVLGWGVAAGVHLAFGSPGGRPTRRQVAAALADLGLAVRDVRLAPYERADGTVMYAHDGQGRVQIRVLGRDEADAQLMSKFWRFVLYKDGGPDLHLTRLEDVEQEAFALLLAERSGASVPTVLVVGSAGLGTALLATRVQPGPRLAELDLARLTDEVLCEAWRTVASFHGAGVAHGRLNLRHVVLTSDGPQVVDFSAASFSRSAARRCTDVAELLVSMATRVGNTRAVACASQVLGSDDLAAALPYFQIPALSAEMQPHTPHERKALRDALAELRSAVAVASGTEPPELQQLYRVNGTNLLMAVGSLVAIAALFSQIGDPGDFWHTISSANWWWLLLALTLSLSTNVTAAIALLGTVPIQLPLWRTAELQLSMSFSNLAVPGVGGLAAQVRYLQKQGVDVASAVAAGAVLATAANVATYLVLFGVAAALSPASLHTGNIPTSSILSVVLGVIAVVALAAAVIWFIPKVRSRVVPRIKSAMGTIQDALRSPRRVIEMFVGNALNGMFYGFVLLACIASFGGSVDYWTVLALNIFVGTLASMIPIPGGGTAVGSVGMTGALTAVGVPTEVAVAAVLANQLVSNFVPALPGWLATKDLLKRDYL